MSLLFALSLLSASVVTQAQPPAAPGQADGFLRLRAVGDVMLGTDFPEGLLPPEDGAQMLADVRDWLEDADVTFANLEGPLCDGGETRKCKKPSSVCYAFRTPTRYGAYLAAAGIDLASTANNHSGDFGEECRRQTEQTLDRLGIKWSGPPGSVATLEVKGKRLAMIAFHTSAATNDVNDHGTAVKLVREARKTHDLVVVSFHGGAEGAKATRVPEGRELFLGENRGDLRRFGRAVIDAGAAIVIGHGPHVARGLELYKGRLIAYSLGNFATYGKFNLTGALGRGLVLEAVLAEDGRFVGGKILPSFQEGKGVPKKDASGAVIPLIRELTAADFPQTGVRISEAGDLSPPLTSN